MDPFYVSSFLPFTHWSIHSSTSSSLHPLTNSSTHPSFTYLSIIHWLIYPTIDLQGTYPLIHPSIYSSINPLTFLYIMNPKLVAHQESKKKTKKNLNLRVRMGNRHLWISPPFNSDAHCLAPSKDRHLGVIILDSKHCEERSCLSLAFSESRCWDKDSGAVNPLEGDSRKDKGGGRGRETGKQGQAK